MAKSTVSFYANNIFSRLSISTWFWLVHL
ncbi:MAG: hypothetical protein RMZ41_001450 [Nostoc sp. DedVER02]